MNKYLCKWASAGAKYLEWHDLKLVDFNFFSDSNGYTKNHRDMIKNLSLGDRVDLSDGISQYHEVEFLGGANE
jgi:hypothetical protein